MLKWFGAGVGCTSAIGLGLYALHVEGEKPAAPIVSSLTLPLESESRASGANTSQPVLPLATETGKIQVTSPKSALPSRSTYRVQAEPKPTATGNGWTLRFVSSSSARLTPAAQRPDSGNDNTVLARKIQREMKRAGCSNKIYAHGYWDKATRSAALRFVRNRNSAIPTDRPDEALLSMLKNYRGARCGAIEIVRPSPARNYRLKQPPKLVSRSSRQAITTGWSTRTSVGPRRQAEYGPHRSAVISSSAVRPSSGQAALRGAPTPAVVTRGQGKYSANGRMALGARSSYSQSGATPHSSGVPAPLAVSPGRSFGPTDTNQSDGYLAPRFDQERAAEIQRELTAAAKRRAQKAKARKRRAARRRSYRKRRTKDWRAKVFSLHN